MRRPGMRWLPAALAALALPALGAAQGVVISGSTSARYVDVHPLAVDSVPESATAPAFGEYRQTADGIYVICNANGWCRYDRSTARTSLVAWMQDLDVTAWGLGEGVSAHAQLRMRTATGGGRNIWPQADQTFEALAAYVEMDRGPVRGRVGRQWLTTGLGFNNFDGLSLASRLPASLYVEGYGGWSLVEGLASPVTDDAISAVEDIPPTKRAYLFGGSLRWRPGPLGGVRVQYQRELTTDRGALYSERAAADGELRLGLTTFTAAATYDVATDAWDEASLRAQRTLPLHLDAAVQARHYEPFFPVWTIWGTFDPVGYDEGRADLRWTPPSARLGMGLNAAWRRYAETNTGFGPAPLRRDGWRIGADVIARPLESVALDAGYGLDAGNGASRSDADLSLRWEPGDRFAVGLRGTAFQTIYEYRIGTGTVYGGGMDVGVRLWRGVRLVADAMLYRQTGEDQPQYADWNQRRGGIRLDWTLGGDPGAAYLAGRKP